MRYLNWDVLLFPGSSRVPLQEFDTKCHVLPDQINRFIDNAASNNSSCMGDYETASQVPVLTSFVSSLEEGSPFRVSVHSWESPKPSQLLRTFKTHDEMVAYEARVYIDGNMVAQRIFGDQAVWPEVIEATGNAETTHPKPIRFPAFHSEILDQAYWTPSEMYGRIRIVLAEGVIGKNVTNNSRLPFDRLRDIIAFSFQHAPRYVLEYSGIAWPHPRLFRNGMRTLQASIANRGAKIPDFEAHAHSPQRRQFYNSATELLNSSLASGAEQMKETSMFEDPFIGPTPISLRGKQSQLRRSSNDASLGDFGSTRTACSHTGTEMSGVSYAKPNFERAMNEAAIDEIVQALSPTRKHDLLQALSPDRKSFSDDTEIGISEQTYAKAFKRNTHEYNNAGSLHSMLPTSNTDYQVRVSKGNLLASRYASVPLLTPTVAVSQRQALTQGLRSSLDPILPIGIDHMNRDSGDERLQRAKSMVESRPRSTSNASKRKRLDSPSADTLEEPSKAPSMSTSPCKRTSVTPIQSNHESPAERSLEMGRE